MNLQFEQNLKQIKKSISDRAEEEKTELIEKSNEQYRRLSENLIDFYES